MRRQLHFPLATPTIRLRLPQDRLPEEKLHALRAGLFLSVLMKIGVARGVNFLVFRVGSVRQLWLVPKF